MIGIGSGVLLASSSLSSGDEVFSSSSRMDRRAASCQEEEVEEEDEEVGLPRPRHIQFVTRFRVDGGISSRRMRESWFQQVEASHCGEYWVLNREM